MERSFGGEGRPSNMPCPGRQEKGQCGHGKSYLAQVCSELCLDLDLETRGQNKRSSKYKTMKESRSQAKQRVERCRQLWENNLESDSTSSSDSSKSLDIARGKAFGKWKRMRRTRGNHETDDRNSKGDTGKKLDQELEHLQNLVRSLENLELEIIAEHGDDEKECYPLGGGYKADKDSPLDDRPDTEDSGNTQRKVTPYCSHRAKKMENSSGGSVSGSSRIPPSASPRSAAHREKEKLKVAEVGKKATGRIPTRESSSTPRSARASSPMPLGHNRTPTPHPGAEPPSYVRGGSDHPSASGENPHKRIRGIWCEYCNSRLVELKRQAVKLWMPFAMHRGNIPPYKEVELLARIEEKLHVPDKLRKHVFQDVCDVCQTHVQYLKGEALKMVQSLERTQTELNAPLRQGGVKMGSPRNVVQLPRTTPHFSPAHHRLVRQGPKLGVSRHGAQQKNVVSQSSGHQVNSRIPSPYSWAFQHKVQQNQMLASGQPVGTGRGVGSPAEKMFREHGVPNGSPNNGAVRPKMLPLPQNYKPAPHSAPPSQSQLVQTVLSPGSSSSNGSSASAAASFFARAALKLNISSRKKKRHHHHEPEPPPFPTNFAEVIRFSPPPAPPCLMRAAGRLQSSGAAGKVKVMLRVCPMDGNHNNVLNVDQRKKQVTVYDPLSNGYTAPSRRAGMAPPKMFAFDATFGQDDSLAELCATSLVEIVQAVVNGADGCLFCYGHARVGKTYSMLGVDDSAQNLGVIPCAIAWLFKLINEQKDKTGARFSVRVSAVEVTGKEEQLKDLLTDVAGGQESSGATAPGVYLRDDPIIGTQIENQSELRAPTAERAAYYLDAAIAARTIPDVDEDARNSHLLFTLHVYQYRVEKNNPRGAVVPCNVDTSDQQVAGGRSRLHLIDLGSCSKNKDDNALSLSSMGNVILALLNGQRHIPHRESKLTQLIRESLGNISCRTCMIAHVSPAVHAYNETLQVIQLASRIHRMKRRRNKLSSSSDDSSCEDSRLRGRMRVGVRMGTLREEAIMNSSGQSSGLSSDPDFTDSSEQSCDTVIYVGNRGQLLSDRELTDNEGPPTALPFAPRSIAKPTVPTGNRSSGDEATSAAMDSKNSAGKPAQGEEHKFSRPQTPKCGANMVNSRLPPKSPARVNPGIAKSGVVQLPRKMHMKGKPPMLNKDQAGEEQWIDGPVVCNINSTDKAPEQWIDGPCVAPVKQAPIAYKTQDSEQWVDGPLNKAEPKKQEQWVDGPMEFQVGQTVKSEHSNTRPRAQRPTRMWSEMPKPDPPPRRHHESHEESRNSHHHRDSHRQNRPLPDVPKSAQPLKNPQIAKLEEDQRPVSQGSVESLNSMDVNPASRPVSLLSEECELQESVPVTPFVKDWVSKHSVLPTEDYTRHRKGHHHIRKEQITMDDMAYGLRSKKSHSPDSRLVCSAQSSPRLRRLKKKDFPPPPPVHSNNRTLAWVQSVQDAASSKLKHLNLQSRDPGHSHSPAANTLNSHTESQAQEGSVPECDQNSPPPDYEHCMENTTPLEGGPVEDEVPILHVTVPSEQGSHVSAENHYSDQRFIDNVLTYSQDKLGSNQLDIPHNEQKRTKLDIQQLYKTNRESIYELQMDEQLETHGGSMQKLAYTSEDDVSAWSNGSIPKQKRKEQENDEGVIVVEVAVNDSQLSPLNVNADAESGIASPGGDSHLSPPSSEGSDKRFGQKLVRPTCLRRPDGASNPNINSGDPAKPFVDSSPEDLLDSVSPSKVVQPMERTCDGQSPEDNILCTSQIKDKASKPPTPTKPSVLPKPGSKRSPTKPAPPPRTGSKLTCTSPTKSASSGGSSGCSSPIKSISPTKTNKDSKLPKDKSKTKLPSPATTSRLSSTKSSISKLSKLPLGNSKSKNQPSPTKSCSSNSGKDSKINSRSNSKSPSPSKRDRENKIPKFNTGHRIRVTDSDSGNDSGIVKNDTNLLSPYAKLTKPRNSTHSSSGHGSDASSSFSGLVLQTKPSVKAGNRLLKMEVSSGYESMVRDSEVTGTSSSSQDSPSECNAADKRSKSNKHTKKKTASLSRRSRSAPARTSTESPVSSTPQSPANHKLSPASPQMWVDTRMFPTDMSDDPLQITTYDFEDVERMARRRKEEAEMMELEVRRQNIRELLVQQENLKKELDDAKGLLMVDARTWGFDCLVAQHGDRDDPDYLEALEKETSILEKRVEACKSRIMFVTCFDTCAQ